MNKNRFIIANGVKVAKNSRWERQYQISDEIGQGVIDSEDRSVIKWSQVADLPAAGLIKIDEQFRL